MSQDIFIKKLNDTETLDLMTMNINLNNFPKEIKIEILKKLPIKQLIGEMGKDADIDNYIIQKLKANKEIFDEFDPSTYFSNQQRDSIRNNQELYQLLPDKLKLKCYSYDMEERSKKEILEILKQDNSLVDYVLIDEYIINNLSNDEILDLCYNACHEFTHLCQQYLNSKNPGWFWELIATNIGNPEVQQECNDSFTLKDLNERFDDIDGYSIVYKFGKYIFENYDRKTILSWIKDNEKFMSEIEGIIDSYNNIKHK